VALSAGTWCKLSSVGDTTLLAALGSSGVVAVFDTRSPVEVIAVASIDLAVMSGDRGCDGVELVAVSTNQIMLVPLAVSNNDTANSRVHVLTLRCAIHNRFVCCKRHVQSPTTKDSRMQIRRDL
jgi:hypothetical protein